MGEHVCEERHVWSIVYTTNLNHLVSEIVVYLVGDTLVNDQIKQMSGRSHNINMMEVCRDPFLSKTSINPCHLPH